MREWARAKDLARGSRSGAPEGTRVLVMAVGRLSDSGASLGAVRRASRLGRRRRRLPGDDEPHPAVPARENAWVNLSRKCALETSERAVG